MQERNSALQEVLIPIPSDLGHEILSRSRVRGINTDMYITSLIWLELKIATLKGDLEEGVIFVLDGKQIPITVAANITEGDRRYNSQNLSSHPFKSFTVEPYNLSAISFTPERFLQIRDVAFKKHSTVERFCLECIHKAFASEWLVGNAPENYPAQLLIREKGGERIIYQRQT